MNEEDSSFILPPSSFELAHRRLYEHLKQSAPELPDNLNDMLPLYHAVAHGCKAGEHLDALTEVHMRRIFRGQEYFSVRKLGSFGVDLAAITCLFDRLWDRLSSNIPEVGVPGVQNVCGFLLRGLGRLSDARAVMESGVGFRIASENWKWPQWTPRT